MAQELNPLYASNPLNPLGSDGLAGIYWRGSDGNIYTQNNLGQIVQRPGGGVLTGGDQTFDGAKWREVQAPKTGDKSAPTNKDDGAGDLYTGGGGAAAPTLDQAKLDSLTAFLARLKSMRDTAVQQAKTKRETAKAEKEKERGIEEGKYKSAKLTNLQDFGEAKNSTDINTRDTLTNLISSLSTLGLGGASELKRQIMNAANRSNRQANATQARSAQELDSGWNEYDAGYQDDVEKIADQYSYDVGVANQKYGEGRQNTYYQMADVYNAADRDAERQKYMQQGDSLNSFITDSAFVNPRYTGKARQMATPELADYNQNIARYDTTGVGEAVAVTPDGLTKMGKGNLSIKGKPVNEKDYGVKKTLEGNNTYGV